MAEAEGPDGRGGRHRWRGKKEKRERAKRKKGNVPSGRSKGIAAEGTGWQKQKRKDWNLMAPEGTGCSIVTAEGKVMTEGEKARKGPDG